MKLQCSPLPATIAMLMRCYRLHAYLGLSRLVPPIILILERAASPSVVAARPPSPGIATEIPPTTSMAVGMSRREMALLSSLWALRMPQRLSQGGGSLIGRALSKAPLITWMALRSRLLTALGVENTFHSPRLVSSDLIGERWDYFQRSPHSSHCKYELPMT